MQANLENHFLSDGTLKIILSGYWTIDQTVPSIDSIADLPDTTATSRIHFDSRDLHRWDSSLLVFLGALLGRYDAPHIAIDLDGLPAGARQLLKLSQTASPRLETAASASSLSLLARIGEAGIEGLAAIKKTVDFIGELVLAGMRMLSGRAHVRSADVWLVVQECGWQALPIVSLISVLVGLILAFMGAVQLRMFGAQIFIADLVGIGMAREMGAVMTGVIMAGRTGAAFAANIGTMQVNEEIDALQTLGISPVDYLVLPRIIALVLMMPLLCIYSDMMGMAGGMVVGVGAFRYFLDPIPDPDPSRTDHNPSWHRHRQKRVFRFDCRLLRLHPRDALWTQRGGCGQGHHLGGRHRHCLYCGCRRFVCSVDQYAWHIG